MACHAMTISQSLKVLCLFMSPIFSSLGSKEGRGAGPMNRG
jgi:hypothetical protein